MLYSHKDKVRKVGIFQVPLLPLGIYKETSPLRHKISEIVLSPLTPPPPSFSTNNKLSTQPPHPPLVAEVICEHPLIALITNLSFVTAKNTM